MSITLLLFCLKIPVKILHAVLLSVLIGVEGCLFSNSSHVTHSGTSSFVFMYNAATSASAVDAITAIIFLR